MGEDFETGLEGTLFLKTLDGKEIEWNGILMVSESEIAKETDDHVIAMIPRCESFECAIEGHVSRGGLLYLHFPQHKRLRRRAIRWYEKLRRQELKHNYEIMDKLSLAVQCATYKGNNQRCKQEHHIYTYVLRMEREE